MARAEPSTVTVGEVAARHAIPESALAKVFQQLVRAGYCLGLRGQGGGYRLTRPAHEVTVLDVISIFENPPSLEASNKGVSGDRLQALFDEVDGLARTTYASVTLDTLAR